MHFIGLLLGVARDVPPILSQIINSKNLIYISASCIPKIHFNVFHPPSPLVGSCEQTYVYVRVPQKATSYLAEGQLALTQLDKLCEDRD